MKVLPIFTSAYSFRSILTLDKPEDVDEGGADSIVKICKEEKLPICYLVEDNMVGLLEAKKNLGKDVQLAFGLRLTFCLDMEVKTEESRKTESKYVIFARNAKGYTRLVEIFTKANVDGYYENGPRMDFKTLKASWSDEDLLLVVPFYDSFIHKNAATLSTCVPDFTFTSPTFFIESNGLFIDEVIERAINEFDKEGAYERQQVKSIYYKMRADFLAWQTYKCIKNESTLRVPNLTGCSSDEFCFESWKEANEK